MHALRALRKSFRMANIQHALTGIDRLYGWEGLFVRGP